MRARRSGRLGRERADADAEHRIRLLANLAGNLAELGLVEEALEACKAINRLRDGLADTVTGRKPEPPEPGLVET